MAIAGGEAWPTVLAAFLASFVEFVEALTVVLAVGSVRGWRGALAGSAAGIVALVALVAVLGPAVARVPLPGLQLVVGTLLLLFGMRWLRKAVLRASGVVPLHDEAQSFARQAESLGRADRTAAVWDRVAVATAFEIVMLEGLEVVFIVIAVGAGDPGLLGPASLGAAAACFAVMAIGAIVHRPLASVPENTLKFVVGVLLSAFGTFWVGEGIGIRWPGHDGSVLALAGGFLVVALVAVPVCASSARAAASRG